VGKMMTSQRFHFGLIHFWEFQIGNRSTGDFPDHAVRILEFELSTSAPCDPREASADAHPLQNSLPSAPL
jgi:hypothetical protein